MENVVIIDSGIGGLSVFNHLIELNCNIDVTYLADNRYFPYGTKSDDELIKIIERILEFFVTNNYKEIILACNTASVIYSKYLLNKYPIKVYPIIDHTVLEVKALPGCKNVGLIGTNNTINSNVYQERLKELNVNVISLGCSELVELCEQYDVEKIKTYLNNHFMLFDSVDTLILGCTHFNVIKEIIANYFNHRVKIVASGYALIESFNKQVEEIKRSNNHSTIFVTSSKHNYQEIINNLFPKLQQFKINTLEL